MNTPPDDRARLQWDLAVSAVELLQADPRGLKGMLVRARHGPVRDALLSLLAERFTLTRVPVNVSAERLCGGLDLSATLAHGHTVIQPGLLDNPDQLLLVCGAERLPPRILALLAATLDRGTPRAITQSNTRPAGALGSSPGLPPIVLVDEGLEDEHGLAGSQIAERLALQFELPALSWRELDAAEETRRSATTPSSQQPAPAAQVQAFSAIDAAAQTLHLTTLADRLGIDSMRAVLLALRAARVSAVLAGESSVGTRAAALAAQLVLAPRARQAAESVADETPGEPDQAASEQPPDPTGDRDDPATEPEPEPPESGSALSAQSPAAARDRDDRPDAPAESTQSATELPETLLAAATAVLPAHLLASLANGRRPGPGAAGRRGASSADATAGRPVGVRRPRGRRPERRISLLETLKAAAPRQRLRGRHPGDGRPPAIRSDDFRLIRYRQPSRNTTLFVVDASGSAAQTRLAEAKGAVELLLAECYVRRDRVALITFRGREAVLDLPPTRSLTRAKRCLAGLPGGGGTPLAAGLQLAANLLDQLQQAGESTSAVFMTDGKANIAISGEASRNQAMDDARQAAARLRSLPARLLLIDTAPRPRAATQELATVMQARYLPLPLATATGLSSIINGAAD